MITTIILGLLCVTSVRSDSSMSMTKKMSVERMPMMNAAISKEKRYLSGHQDGSPCPPFYPHLGGHSSSVTVVKPLAKTVVSPISYHTPTYIHQPQQYQHSMPHHGWQPMQHQPWQPVWQPMPQQLWQPKVIVQKPVFPMYQHKPSVQPHYSQSLVKIQQPIVYQKPLVLLKPCVPMPCKPMMPSYHYSKSEIKYVQPQPQVSYIKVPQHQPMIHHPMPVYLPPPPVHVHESAHGIKEICTK